MLGAFPVVKFAVQLVTTLGAGKVVSEVIKNNVTVPTTVVNKTLVWTGGTAISMMIGDRTSQYVGEVIQNATDTIKKRQDNNASDNTEVEV
jgi:hypothetical protein